MSKQTAPKDILQKWLKELTAADSHERDWREAGRRIVEKYRDRRESDTDDLANTRFNILYANTEVLKGALYSQVPVPDVRRRFLDEEDVPRDAARVLERALSYSLDTYDFDGLMHDCVEDMLLPGRGQARVKYVPTFSSVRAPADPTGYDEQGNPTYAKGVQTDAQGAFTMEQEVVYEEVRCDYVEWDMFRYSPAKRWNKVRWVAFGELMTRDDLTKQFGQKLGSQISLNWESKDEDLEDSPELKKRAIVWTIWNKKDRKVYIVSEGYKEGPLAVLSDPLRLEGFFPCPRPIYDVKTTSSLVPVPNYRLYQDHADQLDEVARRISVLTDALKRRGVYDQSNPQLAELAKSGDNHFVGVEDWTAFQEKGGLAAAIQEMDISNLAKVLLELRNLLEQKKQDIYEIMGISDIMRGATKATETLGAQEIKDKWGSIRIQQRQAEVQRFARDLIRLKGEIIAEHFSAETLTLMTGIDVTEDMVKLLRDDKMRGFKVDIETDSTIRTQADREQKNRVDLLTAITGFMDKVGPAVESGMMPKDLAGKLLMFGIRAFPVGAEIEETLDKWAEGENQPGQPQQPQITPEQQAQMQHQQAMNQLEMKSALADMVFKTVNAYAAIAKAEGLETGIQLDNQRKLLETLGVADPNNTGPQAAGMGQPPTQYPVQPG